MDVQLIQADARRMPLDDGSVHMIATSPPYWGLRDYGTADQLGLEPLHDCHAWATGAAPCGTCYVCTMRAVAAECWRVLRDDGVMWLNLGDSYQSNNSPQVTQTKDVLTTRAGVDKRPPLVMAPKNLTGIPWRVALALQSDGWYLRSDVIWAKLNPMPESVTDRPTKAHEYVFLLAKSARYYYDAEAVREEPANYERKGGTAVYTANGFHTNGIGSNTLHQMSSTGRNRRTVWTIATQPYSGAHFATWPPSLVEPMVKAGCPAGGLVLDPFCGSGTTGVVARQLGRRFVGLDLSADYLQLARQRLDLDALEAWQQGRGIDAAAPVDFGLFARGAS